METINKCVHVDVHIQSTYLALTDVIFVLVLPFFDLFALSLSRSFLMELDQRLLYVCR